MQIGVKFGLKSIEFTLNAFFVDVFAQWNPLCETWGRYENNEYDKDYNILPPKRTSSTEENDIHIFCVNRKNITDHRVRDNIKNLDEQFNESDSDHTEGEGWGVV